MVLADEVLRIGASAAGAAARKRTGQESVRLKSERLQRIAGAFLNKPWRRPTFPRKNAQYHRR